MMEYYNDTSLVERAKLGDSTAFAELVKRHAESVKGYCFYRIGDFEEARDLCQETFILAYTKLHQLSQDSKFAGWTRSIAQNVCNAWLRKRREIPLEKIEPSEQHRDSPAVELVRDALLTLPDKERLAVVLHYVDGLSCSEISQFLEVSESAVRGRLYRGRHLLKKEMTMMARDVFAKHCLDNDFVVKTVHLSRSFTRLGLGWSPDGKHILILRYPESGGAQLWVSDNDAVEAQQISPTGWPECYGWSPDSKKVVYAYTPQRMPESPGSLYIHDMEQMKSREIASGFQWEAVDGLVRVMTGSSNPVWSPDSRLFALIVGRDPERSPFSDVLVYDSESGACTPLAPDHRHTGCWYPGDWSPDGKCFAMISQQDEGANPRVWVCRRDGSGLHPISDKSLTVTSDPRYRPGTGEIAFCASDGSSESTSISAVWITDDDGSNPRKLTEASGKEVIFFMPEWTSDGKYIVYLSRRFDRGGHQCDGVYITDPATGTSTTILESDPESDLHLIGLKNKISICQNGKRIAFTVARYSVDDRSAEIPSYTNRCDLLYYYDIPTSKLIEAVSSRPEEDGLLLSHGGFNWMPLWSPDGSRILYTSAKVLDQESWKKPIPETGRLVYALGSVFDALQPSAEPHLSFLEIG